METQMVKHTPGPWHVNGYGYRRNDAAPTGRECYICSPESGLAEGFLINAANTTVCEIKTHRSYSDAALIAAAPDLLAACKRVLNECALVHKHWGEGCNRAAAADAKSALHAAIARAESR